MNIGRICTVEQDKGMLLRNGNQPKSEGSREDIFTFLSVLNLSTKKKGRLDCLVSFRAPKGNPFNVFRHTQYYAVLGIFSLSLSTPK